MTNDGIATVRLDEGGLETARAATGRRRGWKAVLGHAVRRLRRWRVRPEKLREGHWWNGSLRSADQLRTASERARTTRLPLGEERDRNWDSLEALELILDRADRSTRIADLGLRPYTPLLNWLEILGFETVQPDPALRARTNRRLAGVREGRDAVGAPDLDATEAYGVVTCRTLPGDGVPLDERLDQSARLLEPGGTFILSTEFWNLPDPYQGGARSCARDHLCCRRKADALVRTALELRLVPIAPLYLGEAPGQHHPNLVGVGVSPIKLAFRKREPAAVD